MLHSLFYTWGVSWPLTLEPCQYFRNHKRTLSLLCVFYYWHCHIADIFIIGSIHIYPWIDGLSFDQCVPTDFQCVTHIPILVAERTEPLLSQLSVVSTELWKDVLVRRWESRWTNCPVDIASSHVGWSRHVVFTLEKFSRQWDRVEQRTDSDDFFGFVRLRACNFCVWNAI